MIDVPYSGKFSYGAKFRIFRIKFQDAKIFSMRNFENVKNFDSSMSLMRSTEQFEIEMALH